MADDIEVELQAIKTLQETLEPLKDEVRERVLDYVFRVLGIASPVGSQTANPAFAAPPVVLPPPPAAHVAAPSPGAVTDVLTLTEQKKPTTAGQMIAVVGYYLLHHAPEAERQNFITVDEIQKYFVQARYPLPEVPSMALVHAKNAGYLDVVEKGKYRLNSVGHNLVAHKMPKDTANSASTPRRASRNSSKKTVKKVAKKAKR
ncbi:hypothetical protein E0H22_02695 [Rhodopseudomonas boonkerdii]|uniref:hypothetical protein n=1 Tax=Rhodopseudomonas boonkerdii TaxID=475937 RepID=UPI001E53EB29|nr:hypothetical protein [Rhodopseudomonas boonkerdii]UGV24688.1 hypothetical protein E0H22_02695 [Rhodopseudomonas boonkerdii]